MEEKNKVFVGTKDIAKYISSCFFALNKFEKVIIISRGSHIKKSLDILAILIRDYLDNPEYNVVVKSELFQGKYVTAIEIELTGTKRKEEKDG